MKGGPQHSKLCKGRAAIKGMRLLYVFVSKCPGLVTVGRHVRQILSTCLNRVPELQSCCSNDIGTEAPDHSIVHAALHSVRAEASTLVWGCLCGSVSVGEFSTEIRAHLLEGWRATAGDPDWAVAKWLTADGVPAGLR